MNNTQKQSVADLCSLYERRIQDNWVESLQTLAIASGSSSMALHLSQIIIATGLAQTLRRFYKSIPEVYANSPKEYADAMQAFKEITSTIDDIITTTINDPLKEIDPTASLVRVMEAAKRGEQ